MTRQKCQDGGMARLNYEELNSTIRYAMWSVFKLPQGLLDEDRDKAGQLTKEHLDSLQSVELRGVYDVSGMRADADFMLWTHAETVEQLQAAYANFRRDTPLGRASEPFWSSVAVHRPAEFNKSHVPAFIAGEEPQAYASVYPFIRSYEWYLLPDADRRKMLADHGMAARDYPDVRANTVPAFSLGDYEWILCFEADDLYRISDLMRELRATEARRHTRWETPFFTGPRVDVAELVRRLP